jgi:hypothetical protein
MAESPQRSASGGGVVGASAPTRLPRASRYPPRTPPATPGQLHTRARPPAAPYGPPMAARLSIPAASRLPDCPDRELCDLCRCAMATAHPPTTTRPVAAQPER